MSNIDAILESIRGVYQPPDEPDHHWLVPAYEALRTDRFVLDFLIRTAPIKVVSDLNVDVSLRIEVHLVKASIEVALSCIRPWAMVWRLGETRPARMIVEDGANDMTDEERGLLTQLKAHGFVVLTRDELGVPVHVKLFDTSPEETKVYHALFSDLGTTPPFLQEAGGAG